MRKAVILILAAFLLLTMFDPALAEIERLQVYYAGADGSVQTALELAEVEFVNDPAQADVFVLNGKIPNPEEIASLVQSGKGLVVIMGPEITPEDLIPLLGENIALEERIDSLSLKVDENSTNEIVTGIYWISAPQVRERTALTQPLVSPLVTGFETGETVLGEMIIGSGQTYIFTPYLSEGINTQFQEWPYYNYLIYNLTTRAAGKQPLSFGDYPASPLPHTRQRIILYVMMAILAVITWTIFFFVRRYSKAHPEKLDSLVSGREQFLKHEAHTDWEEIGFHRNLGGFMFALMSGLILFIPLVVYQNFILPVYILPSAQAMGMWGRVAALFPIVWSFFDMGTSVAHMKFFSEYRVKNPRRAIQYAQFYVWWQALTGAIQVVLVTIFASAFLPDTAYAVLIWAIITHVMIQIPGFYRIFTDSLSAYQRADYNQILDIGMTMVIPMLVQPIVISLVVWWGRNNAVFGPAMGGLLGLGISAYVMEVVSFIFGWFLYQRLGYNARLLFLAHFDWSVAKESLKFGFFLFLSGLIGGLFSSLNVIIVQNRLINNNEILGNIGMANNFTYAYSVILTLTATSMPAISEAISNGKKILSQYYASMVYKYGGFTSAFICAILLAVADRFIIGSSGQDFQRAALYVVPMLLIQSLSFASWTADIVMYGANKMVLVTILTLVDVILGFGIAFLLVDRFQVYALIYTPLITLLVKIFLSYFLNNRYCFPQRFYFWQTIVAASLAGLVQFLWMRWFTGLIWKGDEITSIIILAFGLLLSFPVYSFLYGLFGGWDDNTLNQFGRGTNLASFMRPLARVFYHSSRLGARISPLHGRFPVTNYEIATQEAKELTEERVALI